MSDPFRGHFCLNLDFLCTRSRSCFRPLPITCGQHALPLDCPRVAKWLFDLLTHLSRSRLILGQPHCCVGLSISMGLVACQIVVIALLGLFGTVILSHRRGGHVRLASVIVAHCVEACLWSDPAGQFRWWCPCWVAIGRHWFCHAFGHGLTIHNKCDNIKIFSGRFNVYHTILQSGSDGMTHGQVPLVEKSVRLRLIAYFLTIPNYFQAVLLVI